MKIKGRSLTNDLVDYVVLPRQEGNIVFKVVPVTNWSYFEELVKEPRPKTITKAGGISEAYLDDPEYKTQRTKYASLKYAFLHIMSINQTEDLVWDKVNLGDPETWSNWTEELSELSAAEQNILISSINKVNSLDDEYLEKARQSFLATIQAVNV